MALLAAEHLTFCYAGASDAALYDVSLAIDAGEVMVVCGPSGCGKTTLLRLLKPAIAPAGELEGSVMLDGHPLRDLPAREQAAAIGFVAQRPAEQMICADVRHELAFGLENLGMPAPRIRARVAEVATYLGIADLVDCPTNSLSAGQQQMVSVAAVMAMEPRLLVLDEPFACLDPIAAQRLADALRRLNRQLGIAILIAEHDLAAALPLADRLVVMGVGSVLASGPTDDAVRSLLEDGADMAEAVPASARIAAALTTQAAGELPLDVAAGQRWLRSFAATFPPRSHLEDAEMPAPPESGSEPICSVRGAWLRYGRDGRDVLRDASLEVPSGGIHGLLGANGSGKTTLLKAIAGVLRPYRGRIEVEGRPRSRRYRPSVALLPQEPLDLLPHGTVRACLEQIRNRRNADEASIRGNAFELARQLGLGSLLDAHPRDLSAGEQQRVALALVLAQAPRLLLLDEPTRSLDARAKNGLARILRDLAANGTTVLMAMHDLAFCADHADTVALLFDGEVAAHEPTRQAFTEWSLLAPDAALIARGVADGAITAGEVVARWRA